MSFQNQEKQKRVKMAKQLMAKGYTVERLAEYFNIKPETVMDYLVDSAEPQSESNIVIPKEKKKIDLFSFSDKTIDSKEYFEDNEYVEGFKCPLCKKYRKYEAGKKWSEKTFLCIDCFVTLTPEKKAILDSRKI